MDPLGIHVLVDTDNIALLIKDLCDALDGAHNYDPTTAPNPEEQELVGAWIFRHDQFDIWNAMERASFFMHIAGIARRITDMYGLHAPIKLTCRYEAVKEQLHIHILDTHKRSARLAARCRHVCILLCRLSQRMMHLNKDMVQLVMQTVWATRRDQEWDIDEKKVFAVMGMAKWSKR